jgi:predicted CXXCH cytochrome family protein
VHTAASLSELRSPSGRRAMNSLCSNCHEEKRLTSGPHAGSVACNSCHGAHDIQSARVASSALSLQKQSQTCGACHQEVAASWRADAHGSALLEGLPKAEAGARTGETPTPPTCTTCHGGHGLSIVPDSTLARAGQERCAGCHEKFAETFGDSYHGQAARPRGGGCARPAHPATRHIRSTLRTMRAQLSPART